MIRTVVLGLILALASVSAVLLGTRSSLHLVCLRSTEEVEVVNAIAHTYHPVFAQRLVHLYTRHTEVQHSGLAILTLDGHIVVQRNIHTEQWRECLVDAHLRNIEHAARRWIARRGIRHEAQTIHILLIGTVAAIAAHGKDALVGVVDVHTLEVITEPWQLAQSAITHRPVWQESAQCREDGERTAAHRGIGIEECRNHHITTIRINRCAGSIILATAQGRTRRIYRSGILRLHPLAETIERVDKLLESLAAITTVGISDSLESRTQRDGSHLESSALGGRCTLIHILYALLRGHGAGGRKIYLEILDRFQGGTQLQVLGLAGSSRRSNRVVAEQPVVVSCLSYIAVIHQSEGEIQSRRHRSHFLLSEGITHVRSKARQKHLIVVAVGEAHLAQHHCQSGCRLGSPIPFFVIERLFRHHRNLQLHHAIHLRFDTDLVVIHLFIFQMIHLSILRLSRNDESLAVLAMSDEQGSIRQEGDFFLESLPVFRKRLRQIYLILSLGFLLLFLPLYLTPAYRAVESVIRLFEEWDVVVEAYQIEASVYRQLALGVDGVAIRVAVLILRASLPSIVGVVGGIGTHPVEDWQQMDRQLIGCREVLTVVERRTPALHTLPYRTPIHRILPGMILVGIEIGIHIRIRHIYLCMGGTLEVHVQVLGQIPAQRELAVPKELVAHGERQLRIERTLHIAFLQLISLVRHLRIEGDVLRQPV